METYYIIIIFLISIISFCWFCFKCIIFDNQHTEDNLNSRRQDMLVLRQEYRNQLIEMTSNQFDLKETNYEIDRKIIQSLQEKYKIKIDYKEYYKTKHFAIKNQNHNKHCIICLENYKYHDKVAFMNCQHKYHSNCLKTWLNVNPSCPICRKDIINDNDNDNNLINNAEELIININ
jgi:hypothetical protein